MLDSANNYSKLTKWFHWLRVFFLVIMFLSINAYKQIGSNYLFAVHVLTGLSFAFALIVNICYRLFNVYPQFQKLITIERNIQLIIYYNIYFLLVLIIVTGYFSVTYNLNLYLFTLPSVYNTMWLKNFFSNVLYLNPPSSFYYIANFLHKFLFYFLLFLIVIHIVLVIFWQIKTKGKEIKKIM